MAKTETLAIDLLTRVEGEGALRVTVEEGRVVDLRLRIFEPPRFFEAFLRGRAAAELPDLVARICGICPVAYQMSAVHAVERAFGITVDPEIRALRRLYYCGEWIESHSLHVHLLAAPDFFGCESAIELARKDRATVERGLRLKKAGNAIVALLGGRSVHPVGVTIGGFTRAPARRELAPLRDELERARVDARDCLRWAARLPFPERTLDAELVSLRHADEYPMNEGRIVSSEGIDVDVATFDDEFEEYQVPDSNALHARVRGRGAYLVGPLARANLNHDRLPPAVVSTLRDAGAPLPSRNPFHGIVARATEILYAIEEALRVIDAYDPPARAYVPFEPRTGRGAAATEAPRGMLYVAVETDERGLVVAARITPPTSQNLAQIESDLASTAVENLKLSRASAARAFEAQIRNYDPCISCSTHFLRLEVVEKPSLTNPDRPPSTSTAR
jgi:coenzyme F420-reducing hydrogenase alpha subunit